MEIANIDIADVPQDEGHRPTWAGRTHKSTLGLISLVKVPDLAVAVDASGAMSVDPNVVSCQNEPRGVVLELDVIRIIPPILEIFGELIVGELSVAINSAILTSKNRRSDLPPTDRATRC